MRTAAPEMRPAAENWISTNLPKREELSLRTVLALPKASRSGLDSRTCCSTPGRRRRRAAAGAEGGAAAEAEPCLLPPLPAAAAASSPTQARYCIISLAVSVFPAPDSPETRIDWLRCRRRFSAVFTTTAASASSGRVAPHRPVRRVGHRVHVRAQLPQARSRYCSIMCFP